MWVRAGGWPPWVDRATAEHRARGHLERLRLKLSTRAVVIAVKVPGIQGRPRSFSRAEEAKKQDYRQLELLKRTLWFQTTLGAKVLAGGGRGMGGTADGDSGGQVSC